MHLYYKCNHLQLTHLKAHLAISNKSNSVAQRFSILADGRINLKKERFCVSALGDFDLISLRWVQASVFKHSR